MKNQIFQIQKSYQIEKNQTQLHKETQWKKEKDLEITWSRKNKIRIRINKSIKTHLKYINFTTNGFQTSEFAEIIVKTKNPNRKSNQNSTILL